MEVQELVDNLKTRLPYLRKYDDAGVLKYYILTGLNNLKEERNDTQELIELFNNRKFEKLELALSNNTKLHEILNIYEMLIQ